MALNKPNNVMYSVGIVSINSKISGKSNRMVWYLFNGKSSLVSLKFCKSSPVKGSSSSCSSYSSSESTSSKSESPSSAWTSSSSSSSCLTSSGNSGSGSSSSIFRSISFFNFSKSSSEIELTIFFKRDFVALLMMISVKFGMMTPLTLVSFNKVDDSVLAFKSSITALEPFKFKMLSFKTFCSPS
ncbi:hypothetical protein WICPIJ_000112 [Wickerhamomyces pijperi]|uniref:Uncharacterized protein n=1 Tax=Wickerhamomyces pijperi TaxID=599730 RepID=A0A9P8QHC5_WICPI|nr:hypothetical protein WICPIJ_000112 [Wickerhamomyces pijperi]